MSNTVENNAKPSLVQQILRFGVVGFTSFFVDFLITLAVAAACRGAGMHATAAAAVGAFFGFVISLIVNYILSMRFVFERKDDMDRKKEFAIFAILSLIGLGINEVIILGCMSLIDNVGWIHSFTAWCAGIVGLVKEVSFEGMATAGSKIIATGIVMVYNFVSRKKFLEKKD